MKKWFFLLLSSTYLTAATFAPSSSQSFIQVAKQATPSVVSIRVKSEVIPQNLFPSAQNPNDIFGDKFFEHFFALPRQQNQQPRQQLGQASGFIVTSDGYILTNAHVVKNAKEVLVVLNNEKEYIAEMIGTDANTDVALIKIDAQDLPFLQLGNSEALEVGQWVMAIGNPLGLQASASVGIVSAKGRNDLDIAHIEDFIQTDAAINQGNSGGPLLNLDSEVIGINTAILSSSQGGGYMGIGFAIPSNMVKHVMNELIASGSVSRGFLGVILQRVDHNLAQAFGLKDVQGALVSEVGKNSPAEKAGLKQGDIITHYNGKALKNIAALRNSVALEKPGTDIKLKIMRAGQEKIVSVKVGEVPDEQKSLKEQTNKLGLEVEELTPEIAHNLGLTQETGVIITKVRPGSGPSWSGIRKGDLIMEINRQPIKSVQDFERIMKEVDPEKPLLLLIKQGKLTRFISIKLG